MGRKQPENRDKPKPPRGSDAPDLLAMLSNAATEMSSVIDHARSTTDSLQQAIDQLQKSETSAQPEAARPALTDLLSQLIGTATGSRPNLPTTVSENPVLQPINPLTDLLNQVIGTATGARPNLPTTVTDSPPSNLLTDLLNQIGAAAGTRSNTPATVASEPTTSAPPPTGPVTDLLGQVIGNVAKPIVNQAGEGLRQATTPLLGINDVVSKVVGTVMGTSTGEDAAALRKRGSALIRISYKPECQRRDLHPSFSRILDELLPDEARILRFLGVAGTQPMIDVRTKTLFQIGSELLVGGVSMIAQMAGCHWADRDQHYFANLNRLGLIDLSREPVTDYRRYALLEVQPTALHVIESVPKSTTVYRSVKLTAFGQQFVDVCIETDGYSAGGWNDSGRQDKIRGKGSEARRKQHA